MDIIKAINLKKYYTSDTLIVTHQEEVAQMADRVIRMSDGKIYTRDCNDC